MVWFVTQQCDPSFQLTVKIWINKGSDNGLSMVPYAVEVAETPYMCSPLMCKHLWMGMEPQPLHNGMVCRQQCDPSFQPNVKFWINKGGGNGLLMIPYARPLHMKGFKPLICPPH